MPTDITLTEEQHNKITADMSDVSMLDQEEVEVIASLLNRKINLPFVSEDSEQIVFVKLVKLIDSILYASLPNEIYELVKIASDGISPEEARILSTTLSARLNKKFDLPYIPEFIEAKIFDSAITYIISATVENKTIKGLIS